MSAQEPLKPDLAAVEAALASLAPRPATLNRDWVMFLAGRAAAAQSGRRWTRWLWPCATAASLLLALALGVRGQRPSAPAHQAPQVGASAAPAARPGPHTYLKLREVVLARGVDALPEPTVSSGRGAAQPLRPLDWTRLDAWRGG